MSNIKKLAPYVYLAKRNDGSGKYDLFLLVPVGQSGDADLVNASVSAEDSKKVVITYETSNNAANMAFRTRRFVVQDNGDLESIEVKDNNGDNVVWLEIGDSDNAAVDQNVDYQTFAPYVFAGIETDGQNQYGGLSCIILDDNNLGVLNEAMIFSENKLTVSFYIGSGGATGNMNSFLVNQNIKAELAEKVPFTFDVHVAATTASNKPPRKNKVKVLWD